MYKNLAIALITVCVLLASSLTFAQRAGQSSTIRHGVVDGARNVDLNDGNALRGVLVGGAFGSALTRNSKGSSRRDRNTAIGAVIGGAAAASKRRPGMIYSVLMSDDSIVSIATEQTEIAIGDCVTIEQSGSTTNIRRAPQAACAPDSAQVMNDPDVKEKLEDDAEQCAAAKQEMVDAASEEAMDRAVRKIQFLCYE